MSIIMSQATFLRSNDFLGEPARWRVDEEDEEYDEEDGNNEFDDEPLKSGANQIA